MIYNVFWCLKKKGGGYTSFNFVDFLEVYTFICNPKFISSTYIFESWLYLKGFENKTRMVML